MLVSLKGNYFSFAALQFLFVNSTVSVIKFISYSEMHTIDRFSANHPLMQFESYSIDKLLSWR